MSVKVKFLEMEIYNLEEVEEKLNILYSEGWILQRVIFSNLFIFKKTKEKNGEIKILPYELDTGLNIKLGEDFKKLKEEKLKEGLTHICTSKNLHIFLSEKECVYKEIERDKIIKVAGFEQNRFMRMIISLIVLYLLFFTERRMNFLRNPKLELVALFFIIVLIVDLRYKILNTKFIKLNLDDSIDLKYLKLLDSISAKFILAFEKIAYLYMGIFIVSYVVEDIKNQSIAALGSLILGLVIYFSFKKIIKQDMSKSEKIITMGIFLLVLVPIGKFFNINDEARYFLPVNKAGYKLISVHDVYDDIAENGQYLDEKSSLFIPESYEYRSYSNIGSTEFTYYRCANQIVARDILNLKMQKTLDSYRNFRNKKDRSLMDLLLEFAFDKYNMKREDPRLLVDELYVLNEDNNKIICRKGLEVYYIYGLDYYKEEDFKLLEKLLEQNS